MNDQRITRLETRLEQLVEGMFAYVFGKRLKAHDIALQLVRSMENNLQTAIDGSSRVVAPNHYTITVNPDVRAYILQRHPNLPQILSAQITELATSFGYHLRSQPVIYLIGDEEMAPGRVYIQASHQQEKHDTTALMQPIRLPPIPPNPTNPQLIISGHKTYPLREPVITVGRSQDNHIILDDPHISRHHAQIRLRFGQYTLFDADSQSGTYVNDVPVREHRLQSGDVIRLGATSLVYMEDSPQNDHQTGHIDAV